MVDEMGKQFLFVILFALLAAACLIGLVALRVYKGNRLYITNFSSEKYYDIFTGLVIDDLKDKNTANSLVHEYKLGDYLVALDELKTEYTSDDIKKVLEHIDQEYKTETEKIK